ncbi:chromatin modification-related protein EAF1 B isoform X2 [Physcomitrium patens]|uniref:chromatin modification-related protein EAF1 B isoform X2 n=1 Tax=Physcomitrium patens TaxID=3218 RepID=UPI000D15A49A|nr:chromatin modification-related protein EAF1 B-like isoform X2 [Physcomitrium patens]|eukprot:XP_024366794.1 chromatin modification-related protein EAF1 B-like isoform X2 [Physcomitrella patens]
MIVKQDPGRASGFENSVNAEPGPMGAGADIAATIEDIESSPRGAAIEKAQAELRRDLAVREERRRELEFLEKGGEILDFKFGEAPLDGFSTLSPTQPPSYPASSLKSDGEADAVANGDSCKLSKGLIEGGVVEEINDISVALVPGVQEGVVEYCGGLGLLDTSVGNSTKSLNEPLSEPDVGIGYGVHARPKAEAHVSGDRALCQGVGNGHALPKEVEEVPAGEVVQLEGTVSSDNKENEPSVAMSYQVLPQQSSYALSSKWVGLTGSQEYEPMNEIIARCGPVLEQHASELSSRDRAPVPPVKTVQSSGGRVGSLGGVTDRDSDNKCLASAGCSDEPADRLGTHEQTVVAGERHDSGAVAAQVESAAAEDVDTNLIGIVEDDVGSVEQLMEKQDKVDSTLCSSGADIGRVLGSAEISREPLVVVVPENHSFEARSGHGMLESRSESVADGSSGAPAHRNARTLKSTSRGGSNLKVTHRERAGVDTKKGTGHHLMLNLEGGVVEDRIKQLSPEAEPGGRETNGAESQELRTGGQSGAAVGGASRLIGRSGSISGAPNGKYSGMVLPLQKGQDSGVQTEVDRINVEHREKLAIKAHEDFILEKAEHLQAKRKLIEERRTFKKFAEPSRRKSHWDFVLEEMKWMANDFWQERTWKRYQAAYVCLEIATKKGEDKFLAAGLIGEHRRISSILARAVTDFWYIAEAAVKKEKCDAKCLTKEQYNRSTSKSEVVPMDIPVSKETLEKSVRAEKVVKKQPSGVQKYAIQLLKETGSARIWQAKAPSMPEGYRLSNSILEQVHEVSLFYKVPIGAMEAYRAVVEAEHARSEEEYEKRHTVAIAEAEALVAAELAEDASNVADVSFGDFSNGGGSQEAEPAMFMNEGSRISKKKRKKIIKTGSIGLRGEGSGLQGVVSSELGIPSPLVTGKRSITGGLGPNGLPGGIPVKRQRSSATNSRARCAQPNTSPGAGVVVAQKGFGSQSQSDDRLDLLDDFSQRDVSSDTPSSKAAGVDVKRRKKSIKSFDGGMGAGTSVKEWDGSAQELRQEQVKRKAGNHLVVIGGSDAGLDTPVASGSQGVSDQQNSKKQKPLRPSEANSEAALTSGLLNGQDVGFVVGANKLTRLIGARDSHRRVRLNKDPPSTPMRVGIPWSAGEDQAILALVHDLGPNWDLVSDVLSSNSQIKGICRKPQQCKERHLALMERGGAEGLENLEDPYSSQGIVRGPRSLNAAEEDILKHFEQIVVIVQKYGARKTPNECKDQKDLQASHPSHGIVISQFCSGSGGPPNPVQLADRVTSTGDGGVHPHPPQGSLRSMAGPQITGPMPGQGMRSPAGGLSHPPALQGTDGSHLGGFSASPAAMSAATARDSQRFPMGTMNLPSEEVARLQMSTSKLTEFNPRRLQQQAVPAASGVPVLGGLSNSNVLPSLPNSTGGGMLAAPNRGGLSLPRTGMGGMGPPLVSNMGTASPNGRHPLSPNHAASNMSRRIAHLMNLARNCTEEQQRTQCLQQLQTLANQGEGQAVSALSSLMGGGDMTNAADGSNQSFVQQHQHSLQQHQEHHQQLQLHLQHMNNSCKLHAQIQQQNQQVPGPSQAYIAVPTRMREQQQQRQQHQKQRLLGGLPANSQGQHMVVPPLQLPMPSFPTQNLNSQSHILPSQAHSSLKPHILQQVSGSPLMPQVVGSPGPQSSPASSGGLGQLNEPVAQTAPSGTGGKTPQAKQIPKIAQPTSQQAVQQQGLRNGKGGSRGAMLMQGVSSQTGPGQASTSSGNANGQLEGEPDRHVLAGQRGVGQSQDLAAKVASGCQASVPGGSQGGLDVQAHGMQSANVSSVAGQQKGYQHVQQAAQGGMRKSQQGSPSQAGEQASGQQACSGPTSSQQAVSAASSGAGTQQSPQLHRRQVAQAAGPTRRLHMRHPGSSVGVPIASQLVKTGAQQIGHAGPQMASQAGQNPYQVGGTIAMGTNNSNLHGVGLPSSVNSRIGEAQGKHWKANQTLRPSGGTYNLIRTNSPGAGQVPAMANSGIQSNRNIGMSSSAASAIQGVGLGNMGHGMGEVQGYPGLVSPKVGAGPGVNERGLSGSQVGFVGALRNPASSSLSVSSGVASTPSSHVRPSAGSSVMAPPTSSSIVGTSPVGAATGTHQGVSASMSGPTTNNGQLRQWHGGLAASSSSSLAGSSEMAGASGRSGSGSTNSASDVLGSGVNQGPFPLSAEAAAGSS